ncbi:MAG: LysR family transcriptional regulator [Bulleidia sp.]
MSISFQTIELVQCLKQCGSISKAAGALYVSEPALSKKIRKIEEELGYSLVTRTNSGIVLTEAGEIMAREGESLLKQRDTMLQNMQRAAKKEKKVSKTLRVGIANCYSETLLPRFFPYYVQNYPNVKMDLLINQTDVLEKLCIEGKLDIIFTQEEYCDSRLQITPITVEHTVIYLPKIFLENDAIRREYVKGRMDLSLLKDYPQAEVDGHPRYRSFIEPIYKEAGFKPRTVYRSESWLSIISLLEQGLCYTVMPDVFRAPAEKVATVRIDTHCPTDRVLCLAWYNHSPKSKEWKGFIELVKRKLNDV